MSDPARQPPRWTHSTSWDILPSVQLPDGARVWRFRVGDPDDETAPVVFKIQYPPSAGIAAHAHITDYAEIILEGSQQVGHRWHHAGDIRIVKAGAGYGPLVAGPAGATVLIVFRDGRWRPRGAAVPDGL